MAHAPLPRLRVQGRHFVDADGRQILLRGVNTPGNAKVPPFRGLHARADFARLADWGFNCVRLLFTWEAYEPERGQYDADYLHYYLQLVQWAGECGIYVVVDFHQDCYARWCLGGCGEGYPRWAIDPAVPQHAPRNDAHCRHWALKATLSSSAKQHNARAWESFYADTHGARSAYVQMVARVAQACAGASHVLGYDMVNEPWGSHAQLFDFYHQLAPAIRAQHPQAILFVSPQAIYSAGFSVFTMPRPQFDNFCYAPHFYDGGVLIARKWFGLKPDVLLKNLLRTALDWQVPLFLGEFGAPAKTWRAAAYIEANYRWLDKVQASGAQWCYTPDWHPERKDGWNTEDLSICDDQGTLRANFKPRPMLRSVAGVLEDAGSVHADHLRYVWQHRSALGATRLYLPPQWRAPLHAGMQDSATAAFHTLHARDAAGSRNPAIHLTYSGHELHCTAERDLTITLILPRPQ